MSWFSELGKGLSRAFTIPRKDRDILNRNPLAPVVETMLAASVELRLNEIVAGLSDPEQQDAIKNILAAGIESTGILK